MSGEVRQSWGCAGSCSEGVVAAVEEDLDPNFLQTVVAAVGMEDLDPTAADVAVGLAGTIALVVAHSPLGGLMRH